MTYVVLRIRRTKNLQPDWQQATSLAVFAIYIHLNSTGPAPFEVPNPLAFSAAADARWINGLWFASLVLSLAVSLLAILAKQWLNEFKSRMRAPSSSPKMLALRHSAFKGGLERWGMDAFISMLPLLLHTALFFFLIGLCLLLMPLDNYIVGVVIGITTVLGVFYIVAGLAPLFWGDCPSATPMLRYVYSLWSTIIVPAYWRTVWVVRVAGIYLFWGLHLVVSWILYTPWVILRQLFRCFILILWVLAKVFSCLATPLLILGCCCLCYCWKPIRHKPPKRAVPVLPSFKRATRPIYAALRYRPRTTPMPAFDPAKILACDGPLREASVLAWMIRSLPAEEDLLVALCAAGWLPAATHSDYFQQQQRESPLVHEDLRRAAVDALDNIAMRVDAADDAMIASILRACLFVAEGPLNLNAATKDFLSKHIGKDAHDINLLSLSAVHSGGELPPGTVPEPADIHTSPVHLIALSGSRGRPYPRAFTRIVFTPPTTLWFSNSERFISLFEYDIVRDEQCQRTGWKPHVREDCRLRLLSAMDIGLRHSDSSKMYDWERSAIASLYGTTASSLVSDTAVKLPSDLPSRLQWITTVQFRTYDFSPTDLGSISVLLLRLYRERGGCIPSAVLFNILHCFKRTVPPSLTGTPSWILAAFQLPSDSSQLVLGLGWYQSAKAALVNSHLSLLQPVAVGPERSQSPWSQLLEIRPLPSASEELGEIAYRYTILLLALDRRGYHATAQALLRELLPHEWAVNLISLNTRYRHHITLHAKVISRAWWTVFSEQLQQAQPLHAWVPSADYPDATSFVTALLAQQDCSDCAHDNVRILWGTEPLLPNSTSPETGLSVRDSAVWDPPQPAASKPISWHSPLIRGVKRFFGMSDAGENIRTAGQPDEALESGLIASG